MDIDESARQRVLAASNSSTPIEELKALARDDNDFHVLDAVSRNPSTPGRFRSIATLRALYPNPYDIGTF